MKHKRVLPKLETSTVNYGIILRISPSPLTARAGRRHRGMGTLHGNAPCDKHTCRRERADGKSFETCWTRTLPAAPRGCRVMSNDDDNNSRDMVSGTRVGAERT